MEHIDLLSNQVVQLYYFGEQLLVGIVITANFFLQDWIGSRMI